MAESATTKTLLEASRLLRERSRALVIAAKVTTKESDEIMARSKKLVAYSKWLMDKPERRR